MLLPATAFGAVGLTLVDDNSDGDGQDWQTTVTQGDSFSVDVSVEGGGGDIVLGLSFWLTESTSAGFAITGRTINSSSLDWPNAVVPITGAAGVLDPTNDVDLGQANEFFGGLYGAFPENLSTITLDTSGVAPGTYTIVTSGSGVSGSDAYANGLIEPAAFGGGHTGYTVTVEAGVGVAATEWRSVRTHGNGVGELGIVLDSGSALGTIETRGDGIQKIEVDFDQAATLVGAVSVTSDNGGTIHTTTANMINGNTTLELTAFTPAIPDEACANIDLAGAITGLIGDTDCYVRSLIGDVNGSGSLEIVDVFFVKSKNGQTVTEALAQFDINTSGTLEIVDVFFTKSRNGNSVTCP